MKELVDMNKLKIIHMHGKTPMQKLNEFKKNHMLSLCTPSTSSTYSICVEFMRNWFLNKFQPGYFKSEFISGKNILADYLHKDTLDYIKRNKPALMIIPRMDYTYNRDTSDLYCYGRNTYINRARYNDAFFKDPISQNLLSIEMEQLRIEFQFRIKVSEYNHAMDLYKFLQLSCRSNASEKRYISLDFQVPKEILYAIAKDSHFNIDENQCIFLRYLNQHSRLPFSYKFRGTKGEFEYFIRMTDMYVHLKAGEIEVDDGEREGQIDTNYIVSFDTECLFPAPKFYAYYSKSKHTFCMDTTTHPKFVFRNMCFDAIPMVNEKGWNQYLSSDYIEDEKDFDSKKPMVIKFKDILTARSSHNSLFEIAEYTKSIFISPGTFIDIKLFNTMSKQEIDVDWNTYTITTKKPLCTMISQVVLYVDLEYINNFVINHDKAYSTRMKDNHNYT